MAGTLNDRRRLSEDERLDWLRLIRSANVGPRTFHDLVNYCGDVRKALAALSNLGRRGGATRPPRICPPEQAVAELKAARALGIELIALAEPDYPLRLQMIDDPPPLIAVRGKLDALAKPLIAIVGSRNASAAGVKFAERMAREVSPSCPGLRAVLTPLPIAAASRAAQSPYLPAVTSGYTRRSTWDC